MQYPFDFQVSLVIALCVAHNFIRANGDLGEDYEENAQIEGQNVTESAANVDVQPENSVAKRNRDDVAKKMWEDYKAYLKR